ncbi:hypothetical protein ABZ619_06210 [Streptomyces sp. NPDC007851]|uniref:hypothetical protein n=1 Tax=Streptomyces sp. NPDC007851 TaxID=3155008 RepID=UPI0033C945A1
MDIERRERAAHFVELHREGCFLVPNAWEAGSARILEEVGAADSWSAAPTCG